MSGPSRMVASIHAGVRLVQLATLLLALGGCAAQMAFRDARALVAQDQQEAGLAKFQEAANREPGNAEYRIAYLQTRDRVIRRALDQAERLLAEDKPQQALAPLQQVLVFDPQNERARANLNRIERDARHERLLGGVTEAIEKKQYDSASRSLGAILAERPEHARARALQREIASRTTVAPVDTVLAQAFRKPISIQFQDASLRQVFAVIAQTSGLNFIFDRDIKSDLKTSIFLKNSTIESAIFLLLTTNQLEQRVMDANTILIYPGGAAKQKEYQEMAVKTFYIANADARVLAATLKTILKARDVVVDEKLNLVIMRDAPEAIRLAERLVALQDVPEPEVMLDVEILEIKRSRLLELGIAWPANVSFTPLSLAGGAAVTLADLRHTHGSSIATTGVTAQINANKTDGDTNILANPRIRVRNKEKARIVIGDKVPVITTTISPGTGGFASESVSYIDVGLTLSAEPTIYLNNDVAIRVSLEVSNLVNQIQTRSGTTAYQIGTRQVSTLLQLKDGENQVLAGLINNEDRSTGSKLPGLGEVPILGRLFGSTTDNNQKTEIVLSITPHLVRNVQRPDASISEFAAGTDASFRRPPASGAAAGGVEMPASLAPAVSSASPASSTSSALSTSSASSALSTSSASSTLPTSSGQPVPVLPAASAATVAPLMPTPPPEPVAAADSAPQ